MNLLVPVILGLMAMCQVESTIQEEEEEPGAVVTEFANGNLKETLSVNHSTYHTPKNRQTVYHQPIGFKRLKPYDSSSSRIPKDDHKIFAKKIIVPVSEKEEVNDEYKENYEDEGKDEDISDPVPTMPVDFVNEINLMRIPKYELPKTIPYKLDLNNNINNLENNMKDDIEEPDYVRYFDKNYNVPKEYDRFKFNFQGYHNDKGDEEDDEDVDKDYKVKENVENEEYGVNENIELPKNVKVTSITPPYQIVTKNKYTYEDLNDQKNLNFGNFINTTTDNNQCYKNCQNNEVKIPGRYEYNQYLSNLQPSRLPYYNPYNNFHRYIPAYHYYKPRKFYRSIKPSHFYSFQKPVPYFYKYIRKRTPYYPVYRSIYRPSFVKMNGLNKGNYYRKPEVVEGHNNCPPSKIVKEVYVHYSKPKIKIKEVPITLDEANHDENYDHESVPEMINESNDEDADEEESNRSDEQNNYGHDELIQLSQHIDDALFKNKENLNNKLKEGQRYNINDNSFKQSNIKNRLERILVTYPNDGMDRIIIKKTPLKYNKFGTYMLYNKTNL